MTGRTHDPHDPDDRIVGALRVGLDQVDPVPGDVVELAQAALSWRTIEAALAELAYDSSEESAPTGVRSPSGGRMLSFEGGGWTIDVEHSPATGRLIGQVVPAREVEVELHLAGGVLSSRSDELGRFSFDGVSPGPASLVVRASPGGEVVKTEWTVI